MLSPVIHRCTALSIAALLLQQGVPFVPLVEYGRAAASCEHCTVVWCLITECTCPHHDAPGHHHGDEAPSAADAHNDHADQAAASDTAAGMDCPSLCGCDRSLMQSMVLSVLDKVVIQETVYLRHGDREQLFPLFSSQVVPRPMADDIFHPPRAQS